MIFLAAVEPNVSVTVYGKSFLLEPLTFPEINPAHILVMEDEMGRRILNQNSTKVQRVRFESARLPGFPKPFSSDSHIPQNSRLILLRGGGIGDVLMCTPAIRELRKRFPNIKHLTLSTFKSNDSFFVCNPDIDAVSGQPVTLSEFMTYDYYAEFNDPDSLIFKIPMIDYYIRGIGFDPEEVTDKSLVLNVTPFVDKDVADFLETIRAPYERLIYLNGLASDKLRDISPEILKILPDHFPNFAFIISKMYTARYSNESEILQKTANIYLLDTRDNISGYVTALHTCDAVVTTDSSCSHIAAALKKPCLTLFGPGKSKIWASYYPTVFAFEAHYNGNCCRSPCGKNMFSEFYGGAVDGKQVCPEADLKKSRFSPCLGNFSKGGLIAAFERVLGLAP